MGFDKNVLLQKSKRKKKKERENVGGKPLLRMPIHLTHFSRLCYIMCLGFEDFNFYEKNISVNKVTYDMDIQICTVLITMTQGEEYYIYIKLTTFSMYCIGIMCQYINC